MKYIAYRSSGPSGLVQKVAGAVTAVVVAGMLLVFSSVFLAVLAVVAVVGGIWLWWKTRHVRRMMREMQEQMNRAREAFESGAAGAPGMAGRGGASANAERYEGVVIEGEAVRVDEGRERR